MVRDLSSMRLYPSSTRAGVILAVPAYAPSKKKIIFKSNKTIENIYSLIPSLSTKKGGEGGGRLDE